MDSVLQQDFPKNQMEVLIVDGISTDSSLEIIESYVKRYDFMRMLTNPQRTAPFAMNLGIRQAHGDYIIRMDAHAKYASNYISRLIQWSKKLSAGNVGPVCITDVKNKNPKSVSIMSVLSQRFGVGKSLFRLGVKEVIEVDTVPFGCFKKEMFEKCGLYDERLTRNQDIELNKRIKRAGGKIYLVPDVECVYYTKENLRDLGKMSFENGRWNILTIYHTGTFDALSVRHYLPLLFVGSVFLPAILSIFAPPLILLSLASCLLYLITVVSISFLMHRKNSATSVKYLILAFTTLHFSYGVGSIAGVFEAVAMKLSRTPKKVTDKAKKV